MQAKSSKEQMIQMEKLSAKYIKYYTLINENNNMEYVQSIKKELWHYVQLLLMLKATYLFSVSYSISRSLP